MLSVPENLQETCSPCVCHGIASVRTCRLTGNLEPLLEGGESSHEVNVRHRLYGTQQAIHCQEEARGCVLSQPHRLEAGSQAACVRHGAHCRADSVTNRKWTF
jgi:hypothetical protein